MFDMKMRGVWAARRSVPSIKLHHVLRAGWGLIATQRPLRYSRPAFRRRLDLHLRLILCPRRAYAAKIKDQAS